MYNKIYNSYFKTINSWVITSMLISFLVLVPIVVLFYYAINVNYDVWKHIYENLFLVI